MDKFKDGDRVETTTPFAMSPTQSFKFGGVGYEITATERGIRYGIKFTGVAWVVWYDVSELTLVSRKMNTKC